MSTSDLLTWVTGREEFFGSYCADEDEFIPLPQQLVWRGVKDKPFGRLDGDEGAAGIFPDLTLLEGPTSQVFMSFHSEDIQSFSNHQNFITDQKI